MKSSRSPEARILAGECLDLFMGGRLRLIQSKQGYRFSFDAVILADFVTTRHDDVIVDLGTGCGVIPLILLLKKKIAFAVGLEIQEELAHQAGRNVALNGLLGKMEVIRGDLRSLPLSASSADLVICNPPYRRAQSGRINPDARRAIARHEILATTDDILSAAAFLLKKRGRLGMVYPCERLTDILSRSRKFNLEPKRMRMSYPDSNSGAKLALIESCLGGQPGLDIMPPLFGQGEYSIQDQP